MFLAWLCSFFTPSFELKCFPILQKKRLRLWKIMGWQATQAPGLCKTEKKLVRWWCLANVYVAGKNPPWRKSSSFKAAEISLCSPKTRGWKKHSNFYLWVLNSCWATKHNSKDPLTKEFALDFLEGCQVDEGGKCWEMSPCCLETKETFLIIGKMVGAPWDGGPGPLFNPSVGAL